ncbi:GFA family protein [Variovorax arabinosiphilus]|uniref:GFA family protein n=1 Tax=Variovorax arabinosiphilus TaxID=3053498 RepID=UPI00257893CA|nr:MULTISPECIES: hypothetical protein [unclassified Variovorax]MDM0118364.1 hypothetical protein [Variovorax sp. J2L1-78]MDM0128789.1 hypothetical protein [Variovorax sp. J2L1-63]MDM0233425.1 hypothetical protein [Variovorax sp. J2R1-6]
MHLEGSCHCGSVKLCAESNEFLPFMRCYCSIWRKTTDAAGYAINIGPDNRTMKITGRQHLRVYRAPLDNETRPDPSTDCTSWATPAARGDRAWQRGELRRRTAVRWRSCQSRATGPQACG